MTKTASFRPAIYGASLVVHGIAAVFKTAALNHSAISPRCKHGGKCKPNRANAGRYTFDKHSAQAASPLPPEKDKP
jgi:hypothetical protein